MTLGGTPKATQVRVSSSNMVESKAKVKKILHTSRIEVVDKTDVKVEHRVCKQIPTRCLNLIQAQKEA